jgi:beta-galactosidase
MPKAAYGTVKMIESVGLFESLGALSQPLPSATPLPMEMVDQDYGFILYRTRMLGPRQEAIFHARELHDRGLVFLDGEYHATLERETGDEYASFEIPAVGLVVDILVENMGRVSFGPGLLDRKGILGGVTFADQFQFGWDIFPLPLNDLSGLQFTPRTVSDVRLPAFFRTDFTVDAPADTFLALAGWTKGVVWLNGFNLGRYWERGPQKTLYIPAPLLKPGENELIIFELHGTSTYAVEFRNQPELG